MAGRKIRDVADARACLAAVKATRGKSLGQWARERGIDGRSLSAWRSNLARGAKGRRRPRRRRVRLVELIAAPAPTALAARYVVRCGKLAVEVDGQFDEATLRRLLGVVAAC